jgi:hypothetical protein
MEEDTRNKFFNELDTRLKELGNRLKETGSKKPETKEQDRWQNLEQIVPVLKEYANALWQRNISADLSFSYNYYKLTMHYADGNNYSLFVEEEIEKHYRDEGKFIIKLITSCEDNDNKACRSWYDAPRLGEGWSLEDFEKFVQGRIGMFIYHAIKHSGIKKLK